MTVENDLRQITKKIDDFNDETKLNLKLHIEHEARTHRRILPTGLFYGAVHEEIQDTVDARMNEFTKNTDLKPQELYVYLQEEIKQNPTLSKRQLHYLAYDHLEQITTNKFLKKIYKKMKKRMR